MTPITLEVGDDRIKGRGIPTLVDLRGRRWPLQRMTREQFEEMRGGRQQFRGVPKFYAPSNDGHIDIWPCASHQWVVEMMKVEEKVDAATVG